MSPEPENIDYQETINVTKAHAAAARESAAPTARREPLSLWPLAGSFAVTILGAGYLGAYAEFFHMDAYVLDGYAPKSPVGGEVVDTEAQGTPEEQWLKRGAAVYKKAACAGCHMPTGQGIAGQFPPLAGSEYVVNGNERPIMVVLHGLSGPITVKGGAYNGQMPAQGPNLSDKEVAQVVSYIRNEWGNAAPLVSEEQVANARAKYESHAGPFSAADLDAVPIDQDADGPSFEEALGAPAGDAAAAEESPAAAP